MKEAGTVTEVGVKQTEAQLVSLQNNIRFLENASLYPSLRLTASGRFQSLYFKDWFSVHPLLASLAGSLAQPIFNRRKIRTQF